MKLMGQLVVLLLAANLNKTSQFINTNSQGRLTGANDMKYYSDKTELKNIFSIKNVSFEAIGGTKNKHNYFDSFRRLVGYSTEAHIVLPVTRKIQYKRNPSKHKCSARCRSATGHSCECECGGKNHGIDA